MPNEQGMLGATSFDEGASRRIRPGTKAADMPEGPPLVPLKNVRYGCCNSHLCNWAILNGPDADIP
jgi:hypothetical protein